MTEVAVSHVIPAAAFSPGVLYLIGRRWLDQSVVRPFALVLRKQAALGWISAHESPALVGHVGGDVAFLEVVLENAGAQGIHPLAGIRESEGDIAAGNRNDRRHPQSVDVPGLDDIADVQAQRFLRSVLLGRRHRNRGIDLPTQMPFLVLDHRFELLKSVTQLDRCQHRRDQHLSDAISGQAVDHRHGSGHPQTQALMGISRQTGLRHRAAKLLEHRTQPLDDPVQPLVDRLADLLDDPDDLLGDVAETGKLGKEGDDHGQGAGHRLLDLLRRRADLAGSDGGDGIDEGRHHGGNLLNFLDEESDRVVDGDDRLHHRAGGVEHADQLHHRGLDDLDRDHFGDLGNQLVLQLAQFALDLLPCGRRTFLHQRDQDPGSLFQPDQDRLGDDLQQFAADVLPGQPEHRKYELDDLDQRERFRDVNSRGPQGAGDPLDQRRFQVRENVRGEHFEALSAGAHQVADKTDGVLEDGVEGRLGFPDIRHHARRHHREQDLQQADDLSEPPTDELPGDIDKRPDDPGKGTGNADDVLKGQRTQRVDDLARHRAYKTHQAGQRALEPRPGTGNGIALPDVFPNLFLADQLHEPADQGFGGTRHRFAADRIFAEDGLEQVVAARSLRQRRQRFQDGVLDHLEQLADHRAAKGNQACYRLGEDALGALPDAAQVENVAPAQGIQEAFQTAGDITADVTEQRHLLFHPGGGLVDHAVIVQRLGDEGATRHQFDQGTQEVGRAAVGGAHVDRVESEQQGQHPEAGDQISLVGEIIERVAEAEALHRWRGRRRADLRAALHGVALLDGVRQFVGQQLLALAATGLVLVTREKDVILVGECARAELVVETGGLGVVMHADVAEIGAETRFHVAAHVARQRLAAAALVANRRLHAAADRRGRAAALALQPVHGRRGLLQLVVVLLPDLFLGQGRLLDFLFGKRRFLDLLVGACCFLDFLVGFVGGLALQLVIPGRRRRGRHADDLFRHPVGFLFELVARFVDRHLELDGRRWSDRRKEAGTPGRTEKRLTGRRMPGAAGGRRLFRAGLHGSSLWMATLCIDSLPRTRTAGA